MSVHWILMLTLLASSGVARKPASVVGMKAPSIASRVWLNTEPLGPRDFEGKVVLVQFWTFQSTPCMSTVPALRKLDALLPFKDALLVSVHTPASDRERERVHLEDQIRNLDIDYPVAVDNDRAIWSAFKSRRWPTLFVVDRRGVIRHIVAGELLVGSKRWDDLLQVILGLQAEVADSVGARRD